MSLIARVRLFIGRIFVSCRERFFKVERARGEVETLNNKNKEKRRVKEYWFHVENLIVRNLENQFPLDSTNPALPNLNSIKKSHSTYPMDDKIIVGKLGV
ncbi:MAG TPA: hypothetical protein VK040_02930 [Balneolaceae bacterium]|nr:hypothetical protein [Balneolaceae bacterium]